MKLTLDELIQQYAMNKSELDSYKKICDKENSEIKDLMLNLGISEKEAGGYIAKRIVSKRETMNEERLLSLFGCVPAFNKVSDEFGIIKTKEYIDYDALENAIYNGKLSKELIEEINRARETKEIVTLKLTRVKENR